MTKKERGLLWKIYPHIFLVTASLDALEKGRKIEDSNGYSFLTSILFTAFAIESYLNEVGGERIPCWKEIERFKNPEEKLKLLLGTENYKPDFKVAPFSSFRDIFKFRNSIAHAKPEVMLFQLAGFDEQGWLKLPNSNWWAKCTYENAKQYYNDANQAMNILHKELKLETLGYFTPAYITQMREKKNIGDNES